MPVNPLSGFFGGLATGIFDSQVSMKQEKEKQDEARRRETVGLLSSLLEDATPETKPLLLQQIGDTMKLQGPHKNAWQSITQGLADNSYQEALGSKLQEILRGITSTDQVSKRMVDETSKAYLNSSDPFDPSTYLGAADAAKQEAERGKVILRNPQTDAIEKLRTQYQLQTEKAMKLQEDKHKDEMTQQQDKFARTQAMKLRLEEEKWTGKAKAELMQRATVLAKGGTPTMDHLRRAAEQLDTMWQLQTQTMADKDEAQRALVTYRKAAAEALGAAGGIGGLGAGEVAVGTQGQEIDATDPSAIIIPPGLKGPQRLQYVKELGKQAESLASRYSSAIQTAQTESATEAATFKYLNEVAKAKNWVFDGNSGQFYRRDPSGKNVPLTPLEVTIPGWGEAVNKYSKAKAKRIALEGEISNLWRALQDYTQFYDIGSKPGDSVTSRQGRKPAPTRSTNLKPKDWEKVIERDSPKPKQTDGLPKLKQ